MLTANHVETTSGQSFTFDGLDSYALDTGFAPTQVAAGVDLKVFRLTTTPTVGAVTLSSGGELVAPATMVGWGRGRDPTIPVNTATVTWGDLSTVAKRWGLNTPQDLHLVSYDSYSFTGIRTILGSAAGDPAGLGDDEAAATQYDSGSGLFQYLGGQWRLIGVAAAVEVNGSSFFGDDSVSGDDRGDFNYFVHINSYRPEILALIPEPSSALLLAGGLGPLLRRRVKRD